MCSEILNRQRRIFFCVCVIRMAFSQTLLLNSSFNLGVGLICVCIYEVVVIYSANWVQLSLLFSIQVSRLLIVVVHFDSPVAFDDPAGQTLFYKLWSKMNLFFLLVAALTFTCHVNWEVIGFYIFFHVVSLLYFDFVIAVLFEGKQIFLKT